MDAFDSDDDLFEVTFRRFVLQGGLDRLARHSYAEELQSLLDARHIAYDSDAGYERLVDQSTDVACGPPGQSGAPAAEAAALRLNRLRRRPPSIEAPPQWEPPQEAVAVLDGLLDSTAILSASFALTDDEEHLSCVDRMLDTCAMLHYPQPPEPQPTAPENRKPLPVVSNRGPAAKYAPQLGEAVLPRGRRVFLEQGSQHHIKRHSEEWIRRHFTVGARD